MIFNLSSKPLLSEEGYFFLSAVLPCPEIPFKTQSLKEFLKKFLHFSKYIKANCSITQFLNKYTCQYHVHMFENKIEFNKKYQKLSFLDLRTDLASSYVATGTYAYLIDCAKMNIFVNTPI